MAKKGRGEVTLFYVNFITPNIFHEEYDLLKNAYSLTLRLFSEKDSAGGHCNVGNTKKVLDAMFL